jgi:hypothetical protein
MIRIPRPVTLFACAFSILRAVAQTADPWNTPALPEQAKAFTARFPAAAIVVVPESRDHPLRLLDALPSAWIGRPDDSLAAFGAGARPGEYFVFQLCVFAAYDSLENVRFSSEGLGGTGGRRIEGTAITCFNTGGTGFDLRQFTRRLDIPRGRLQPLWVGIQVPPGARGSYNGVMTVSSANAQTSSVRVTLDVLQGASSSGANQSDSASLSRLRWLNSTIGGDERVTKGYTQIRRAGNSYRILGREVTIGDDGLPEAISSFFTGSNQDLVARPSPVLQGPMRFQIETSNGGVADLVPGSVTFTKSTPRTLEWESTSSGGDLDLVCSGHAEFDGSIGFHCVLSARRDMPLRDVRLELPLAMARYMMGLGRMGGIRPDRFEWTWDVLKKDQDMVWLGNVNGGIRLRLKSENYTRPLMNVYYGFHPLNLPASWGNRGKGGIAITSAGGGALLIARSGARVLRMGEQLPFDFDLLVTPFHLMNRAVQFNDRYYHTSRDVSADYLPEALAHGANIINIHHKSDINPFINYPYLESNVPYLRSFIDSAHGKGVRVKVYYTTRELTVNFPEFWALRSLNGEVIFPGPGNGSRTVIHPDGPPAWMVGNLKENYLPAWVCEFKEGRYKGVQDMAVITTPDSRWNNFYLEGLNWMTANLHIDGIYVDDCALDRTTMQRARKILDDNRPEARIDLHSWNHFCDVAGWASCLNIYMDLLPYVDLVWIGEGRDYDLPPDNWLVEVSGIPFGLPGQMLAGGGNRWRGMVYGMTNRLGWAGPSPDPLWKFWDAVKIQEMEMIGYWDDRSPVRCSSDSVKVTVYRSLTHTLLALGNWGKSGQTVALSLDMRAIGLGSMPALFFEPEIPGFQPGSTLSSLRSVAVPGGEGRLILFENK